MLRPLANICLAIIFWPYLFGQQYPFHLYNSGGAVDQIHGDQTCDKISIIVVATFFSGQEFYIFMSINYLFCRTVELIFKISDFLRC